MKNIPVITQSVNTFKQSVKTFKDSVIYSNNYAWIPLKPNSKEPLIKWKEYQKRTTSSEEGEKWFKRYKTFNYGLITGKVNNLIVVDIDNDLEAIFQFEELFGEATNTTSVITNRGKHYYYSLNSSQVIKTQIINYSGIKLEIKGEGSYVVAPPSTIEGFTRYYYRNRGLEYLRYFPDQLSDQLAEIRQPSPYKTEIKQPGTYKPGGDFPYKYEGKADCVRQILDRELKEGERQNSFFVLASLLDKAHNQKKVIETIIYNKNRSIAEPLSEEEIRGAILSRTGKYANIGCEAVNRFLPYIDCSKCAFLSKGGSGMAKKGGNEMINKEFINKLTPGKELDAFTYRRMGFTPEEIAIKLKVSKQTVYRYIANAEKKQTE
ncbi:MAG: hypothetical protein DDT23_01038 [candidate division WS2 bacterium]|nr:hypothetical protein [Candidatus Lithacetigena glycinireducens]